VIFDKKIGGNGIRSQHHKMGGKFHGRQNRDYVDGQKRGC